MKTTWLDISGKKSKVMYENVGQELWIHVDGETYSFKPEGRKGKAKGGKTGGKPGEVVSPMPGKIIKVLCEAGESVAEEQPVIVLEAMKMEYTLKSNIDGLVETVNVAAGDQVKAGALLVKLVKSGEEN